MRDWITSIKLGPPKILEARRTKLGIANGMLINSCRVPSWMWRVSCAAFASA